MPRDIHLYGSLLALFGGLAVVAYLFAQIPVPARPMLGTRGGNRRKALEEGGGFAAIEPMVRVVAGWFSLLSLPDLRKRLERELLHAGDPLGLSPDELLACSLFASIGVGGLGQILASLLRMDLFLVVVAIVLGAWLPFLQVRSEAKNRIKQIERGLPAAIDLAALCMGAGLDFPGALRQVASHWGRRDPLHEELTRILRQLELGRTRRQALEELELRCPGEAVRSFVGAVIQAEEKGTPLAEILQIQATMLRMRRSVKAEEAAARAGVMMMGPLVLLLGSILLVLVGPFVVSAMVGGY